MDIFVKICEYASHNKWGKAWNPDLISSYIPVTVSLIFHNLESGIKMWNVSVNPAKGPDALLHIKERACDTIIALGTEILFIN